MIQISDIHLDTEITMGVDSEHLLSILIKHINQHQSINTLIATGDLVHHASLENYQKLGQYLAQLTIENIILIAGNHDDKQQLSKTLPLYQHPSFYLDNWQIITLNSVVENQVYGHLSSQELNHLKTQLNNTKADHIFIMLHHPIVPMQSSWDDELSLKNPNDLFNVVKKYPIVKAISWGHAHQYKAFKQFGVKLYSCPSTIKQFVPVDYQGAYLQFNLLKNGRINHKLIKIN